MEAMNQQSDKSSRPRVEQPWTNFLAYVSGLQTHSFSYQTHFGGRTLPTKPKIIPQRQDGRLLPKLRAVDEDTKAAMAYEKRLGRQREVQKKIRENFPEQPLAVLQFKFGLIHHLKYHKLHFQCKKLKHLLQYHPAEQCRSLGTSCITKRIVAKDTRWWRWWTGGMCSGE